MTELDQALEKYIQDDTQQVQYYSLVLETEFYIPLLNDKQSLAGEEKSVTPLAMESDGKTFLMLFDTEERLSLWAKQPIKYMRMTGAGLGKISTSEIHWAINIGGQFAKEFVPAEINWMKTELT